MIESISNYIALRLGDILDIDNEQKKVLAYGAFGILQTLWSILLVAAFGLVFSVLSEVLIVSFTAAILKKFSGGPHATSPGRCALIGVLVFGGLALSIKYLLSDISAAALIAYASAGVIFSCYSIARYAPVDNPNKPINKEKTRKRLKRDSIIMLFVLGVLISVMILVYLKNGNKVLLNSILALITGLLWQTVTLTYIGQKIVSGLDIILKIMSFSRGGEAR